MANIVITIKQEVTIVKQSESVMRIVIRGH